MEQPSENLHGQNDHVLDIPNDGQHGNNVASRNSQELVIQPAPPREPFSCLWIFTRLAFNLNAIVASIFALAGSWKEKPPAPFSAFLTVGYVAWCVASIPIILQQCFLPYLTLIRFLECFKWMLKAYFFIWFVIGNVWLFGGYSSEAGSWLRMVLLFGYIEFTVFILRPVLAWCCEVPGLTSVVTIEHISFPDISSLSLSGSIRNTNSEAKGGVEAARAEKHRVVTGDDVCCICLVSFAENDVLKELPCSHFFHATCVDKWLKMKAICPLCNRSILSEK